MFWTRLLSGIVLLAIALATFSFGNVFLAVPLWLISLIAYRELTKALKCATDEKKFNALEWIGFVGVTAYYATLFFTSRPYITADVYCSTVHGGNVLLCGSLSEISGKSGHGSSVLFPVCTGAVVLCLSDPRVRERNLSGMADPDQFMGMRYLCLCRRQTDRKEAYFPGIKPA